MRPRWAVFCFSAWVCCTCLASCRVTIPLAPAPEPAADASDPGAEEENKKELFTPPHDWCGTDRTRRFLRMEEPRQVEADGRWKRLFVKHTGHGWVLITEWGEDRDGTFETWEEESALPRGIEGKPDSKLIRTWMHELYDQDEEVVFRAALALGAHGVHEAVPRLAIRLDHNLADLFVIGTARLLDPDRADPPRGQRGYHAALAVAIALGQIKSADGVSALISDGLVNKHVLVCTAVREALHSITGNEIWISDRVPESRVGRSGQSEEEWITMRLREEWGKWWGKNEDAVRTKLKKGKQPASPPPQPKSNK